MSPAAARNPLQAAYERRRAEQREYLLHYLATRHFPHLVAWPAEWSGEGPITPWPGDRDG